MRKGRRPLTETNLMRLHFPIRRARLIAVAGVLATASLGACTHRNNIYDPTYNDTHRWNAREDAAYRRWEAERRLQHDEYSRRAVDQQRAYWTWRHQHPDMDR
jgi:hypothetical protein